jgi:superfamily II RNA helicase
MFHINKIEHSLQIRPFSKPCAFHLSNCIESWLRGETFDKILRHTQADEGEVVRYFRMSIQILREILDAHISDSLKQKIHKTISSINRDVIDAEKQLRA